MNSFYDRKPIINKESLLLFRICLSFRYCFICTMSKTLHFLPIISYYRIVNETAAYTVVFWCNKFSILFQHVFNKICNLSNFLIHMHTAERCLSGRDFNKFLVYSLAHINVVGFLYKCQSRNKRSSGYISNSSILGFTQSNNPISNVSICKVVWINRWPC